MTALPSRRGSGNGRMEVIPLRARSDVEGGTGAAAAASPGVERFRKLALIRIFEETLLDLFSQGRLSGTTHTCIGQEASAVGLLEHLGSDDAVFSNHRCHGHYIARFDDPEGLLAEVLGMNDGICRGIGGSQHLQRDHFFTNGIQGGIVPCAAGFAMGSKLRGAGEIAMVFLGDGTLGEGVVYETMNIASLRDVPLLFVVEDNGWAQSTPTANAVAGSVVDRGRAFGIEASEHCSSDVDQIQEWAGEAIRRVRDTSRPYWLVLKSFRAGPHSKGDDTRSEADKRARALPDPLEVAGSRLSADLREEILARCHDRIASAVASALAGA